MNYETYILKFKGSDSSYLYPISINLDTSWTTKKQLSLVRAYTNLGTILLGQDQMAIINTNCTYSKHYEGHSSESSLSKELMRFHMINDAWFGWRSMDENNRIWLPEGVTDLKIWITGENGGKLNIAPEEISTFELVLIFRVYN